MTGSPSGHLTVAVSEHDHARGPADAPVTLVVYGDYECPYTRRALGVIARLRTELADRLCFVFRNFPLTDIHPHALQAAEAAEAANAQDRFWEMHDYLFAHQHSLEEPDLLQYASDLDLDTARFEQDLAAHTYMGRIREDFESGRLSGVQGTPTLFINGALHYDSWEYESLEPALQRAIDQASA